MRSSTVLAILSAAVAASASTLWARQDPPSCAIPCMVNADYGDCQGTDNLCLCNNLNFVQQTTNCIFETCDDSSKAAAVAFAQEICSKVGVDLKTASITTPTAGPTATSPSNTASGTSASNTATGTSQNVAPTSTGGAVANSANTLFGLAAAGLVALAL